MSNSFDELDAIARKAQSVNYQFHQIAKEAYLFGREHYADRKYDAFRDSAEGKAWKQQKLAECGNRCPECNKIINHYNADIDHKHPRRYYPWMAWDLDNLWILCRDCNKNKSDLEWKVYLNVVRKKRGQVTVNRILKYAPPAEPSNNL